MLEAVSLPDFVQPRHQFVTYRDVRDLARSERFYGSMGFEIETSADGELKLSWEGLIVLLHERAGMPSPQAEPPSGLRVIVHDVDTYWSMAKTIDARVIEPIHCCADGLRSFVVADPDGFGLRFATPINVGARPKT